MINVTVIEPNRIKMQPGMQFWQSKNQSSLEDIPRALALHLHHDVSCIDLNINVECVDDLYLHITNYDCALEQKAHGLHFIGVANKNTVFMTLMDLAKQFEAQ